MPFDLDGQQELLEHEPRMLQMTTNIEQMNANMEKMRADIRSDRLKVTLQVIATFIAGIGVGVGLLSYFGHGH